MSNKESSEGLIIGDIVKEYPDMVKIVIYHNNYVLSLGKSKEDKQVSSQSKKEESIHRSMRRTKTTIKDIMMSNRFDLWCTFTYNCRNCKPKCDNKPCTCLSSTCKRYDLEYTSRTLRTWFNNQRRKSPDLLYLAVPEYHKNGAIHFHCMMSGYNGTLKDSGKKTKHGQTVYNARGYYSGWTEFVKIGERFNSVTFEEDYKRVANYLTKYITKDMPKLYGRRRFLVSKNLIRPITTVNGVSKYRLQNIIRDVEPDYINAYMEVQQHKKMGKPLVRDWQSELL